MQNNKTLLLLLVLASCTQNKPETLLSRWEKKTQDHRVVERAFASSPSQGQCLQNIYSVELLKVEIKDLEKKYAGAQRVNGTWKHLNLANLPVPQANFLKTFGSQIGDQKNPDSIDYSTCDDVPCLFNKIYGKDDDVAGYVHYGWYLKTGQMLAADNRVPEQKSANAGEYNGKAFPLSAYLYSDKELYAIWRLSLMLKAPHTTLKYLKEIQRLPKDEPFEGMTKEQACGLAYSQGYINLQEGCLSLFYGPENGYLYQSITHEMSHHVDFEEGRGTAAFYRSYKPDYLAFTGMTMNEFVDDKGVTQRQWVMKPGTKLVSPYAGTAPQENFAESLAVFRVNGDEAKSKMADDHYNFVASNYYQNKYFEREILLKEFILKNDADTGKAVLKAVIDCSNDSSGPKSTYFRPSDFSTPALPGMLNCFSVKAASIADMLRAKISVTEAEGCSSLNDKTMIGKWDPMVKQQLKGAFDRYLQELQKDKNYLARIQDFYNQVSDKTIARDAYINCYNEKDEAGCYAREIQKGAYDKAASLNLPPSQTEEMAQTYTSYHPYDEIRDETKKFYQTFVAGNLEAIRTDAINIWNNCYNVTQNDDQQPTGNVFTIADGYMISSMYNCLNANIPYEVKETVRKFSYDGLKLENPKEELMLVQEVRPQFINILKAKYAKERDKEVNDAFDIMSKDNGQIRSRLLANFSWVKNVVDTRMIMKDCIKEGVRLVQFSPVLNLKNSLFSSYVEKNVCVNIAASPEFSEWLNNSSGVMSDKVTTSLEDKLTFYGLQRADDCLKKYPNDTVINKVRYRIQRDACLVNEWPNIENKVLSEALQDPMVRKLQMSPEVLRGKLQASSRRIQVRILKEKFNQSLL